VLGAHRHVDQIARARDDGDVVTPLAGPYSHPISMGTAYRVWKQARRAAMTT
jgi:hypothetical protein